MTEPSLPAVRPEYFKVSPPADCIMLCDQCQRHLLRFLQASWWCYGCGHRPTEPTLVYDRRP